MKRRNDDYPDNGFEAWGGYMQAKISKLEEQFCLRAAKDEQLVSNIFNGISIYVNGYTNPSADELKSLMAKHGGIYHTYQRSDDYIIASNLPDFKVKKMTLSRVVTPEWITKSLAANRLLDYREFLLYKNSKTQPKLHFIANAKADILSDTKNSKDENVFLATTSANQSTSNTKNESSGKVIFQLPDESSKEITKTAADPSFISEFYSNSRLHHISQLGACFKQYINELRENSEYNFPARSRLVEYATVVNDQTSHINFDGGKVIMHIDMDCFFVSVGLRKRPDLQGKPVAVTHSKGGHRREKRSGVDRTTEFHLYKQKQAKKICKVTGLPDSEINENSMKTRVDDIGDESDRFGSMSEIASCSYEARLKGVSNGMFMGSALRLCPGLQTIPYDFEEYKEVAYTLYNTVAQYTLDIEAVSCDEMYVDCTELLKSISLSAEDFATALRQEIKEKTGCPCSTGFGGNRLQARLATKHAKPNGQFFLNADLVNDFMFNIKLKDLPGVGRQTAHKLETLGHQTCGSLQNLPLNQLQNLMGKKTGLQLYSQCRGQDPQPLVFHTVRKSVSAEVNYGIRFENEDQCNEFLKQLSAEVHSRMVQFKVTGKCITLKLMVRAKDAPIETAKFMGHGFCDIINKSVNLNSSTNDGAVIFKEIISICKKQNVDPKEMRGIGIQVSKLESTTLKQSKGAISKFLLRHDNRETNKIEDLGSSSYSSKDDENSYEKQNSIKDKLLFPKKPTFYTSPTKKSPIIGFAKSPVKRRGRPPKNISMKINSTSNHLISNFLQGSSKDNFKKNTETTVKAIENVKSEQQLPDKPGLLGLSWRKVRELMRAWLDSGQAPLPCDTGLIASYMREMVLNKDIDKLNILLNFMRRRINDLKCKRWSEVYEQILEQVQNAMLAVYGMKLYINS